MFLHLPPLVPVSFFSCHAAPLIGLPSHSPLLISLPTLPCPPSSRRHEYYSPLFFLNQQHCYSSFSSPRLPVSSLSTSLPCRFQTRTLIPSPAAARSLCLALMTSVLGSVTVETKVVRHGDVTNCTIASVCVRFCVRVCVC